jgi:hypothetical protein
MSDCSFVLQPLDQSDVTSVSNLVNLNYTNQDFYSMKTRLVSFIQERFVDDFNDFVESDLGIMLIENWAFIADTLSFKMDQIVNEIFIDTVAELENAFRLCELIGFFPVPPIAAKAMFSATIQTPLSTDLVIPVGLRIDVPSGGVTLTYELFPADSLDNPIFDQDITIPSGSLTNTSIVGLQGQTIIDNFVGSGVPNQSLSLNSSPVIYDSIRVDVDGQRWDQVLYFTDSKSRNEYRVDFDSTWKAFIMFGNGMAGRSPSAGSQITVTYRVGGGTIGNIITGFVSAQRGFPVPGFNFSVSVSISNYTRGEFGYDGDTIDDIRRKLPQYAKSQNRAVTGSDYKTLTDLFVSPYNGQIGKSLAALRNYGCAANIIDLYILAKDGVDGLKEASDNLKAELSEYINQVKMMTDFVCIKDGVIVLVDVVLDIVVDKFYKKFGDEINAKIKQRMDAFFILSNWEYGENLRESDLIRGLADMKEIDTIDATFTTADPENGGNIVTTQYYEIIRLDNLTINLVFQ